MWFLLRKDYHHPTAYISMPTTNRVHNMVLNTLKCNSAKAMPEEKWMYSLPQVSKRSESSQTSAQIPKNAMFLLPSKKKMWRRYRSWITKPPSFVSLTYCSFRRPNYLWTRPRTNLRCFYMNITDTLDSMHNFSQLSIQTQSLFLSIMDILVLLLIQIMTRGKKEISYGSLNKQVWLTTLS